MDLFPPEGFTIELGDLTITVPDDLLSDRFDALCELIAGQPFIDLACGLIELFKGVEETRPFLGAPLPFAPIAETPSTAYSEAPPTELQSIYYVVAVDREGQTSDGSNIVGGPSFALPTTTTTTSTTTTTLFPPGTTTTTTSTTTTTLVPDEDGVSDKIEDQAPNNGDGNADGTADRYQVNVTSLRNTGNGEFITIVSPEGTELAQVRTMGNPAPDTHPLDVKFSMGFLCFTVTNFNKTKGSATVEILRHGTVHEVNTYWKYGRTSDDPEPHWYEFLFDGTTGAEILGDRILIHLADGKRGDDDLTVNGRIIDPGGPGFLVPSAVPGFLELGGTAQSIQMATSGLQEDDENFVGVAVFNPHDRVNGVSFSAINAAGSEVARIELEGGLPARGQRSFLTRELVDSVQEQISLISSGKDAPIQSFFLIGDNAQTKLDGVAGEFSASGNLVFPVIRQNDDTATLLFLFNPSATDGADVNLKLFDPTGKLLSETSTSIRADGFLLQALPELFLAVPQMVVEEGYIRASSNVSLVGFEFLASDKHFSSLAGQSFDFVRTLVLPHFFGDNRGGSTEVRILNNEENFPVLVKATAFNDDSEILASKEFTLAPGQLLVEDVITLMNLTQAPAHLRGDSAPTAGYLELEMSRGQFSGAKVLGAVRYVGNHGEFSSLLPLLGSGRKYTRFLHVAQSDQDRIFTGLTILNSEASVANVRVQAFDGEGNQTALRDLQIPAQGRVLDVLNGSGFFGKEFVQIGGHVKVTSDVPIFTFSLFGDLDSTFLSAIEGQSGNP